MFRKSPTHFFGDIANHFYGQASNAVADNLLRVKEKASSGLKRVLASASRVANDNIVNIKRKARDYMPNLEGEPSYKRVPNPGGIDRRKSLGGDQYRKSTKYKERFPDTVTAVQPEIVSSGGGFWDSLKNGAGNFLGQVKDAAGDWAKEQLASTLFDVVAL